MTNIYKHDRLQIRLSLEDMPMPKYGTLNCTQERLRLQLKPKGLRGLFRKVAPYLSGDVLDLELHVKSGSDSVQQYEYWWQLQELLPDKTYRALQQCNGSFKSKPLGTTKIQLDTYLIQHEDEYHVIVSLKPIDKQSEPIKQTLLNFKALARDAVITNCLIGLATGFIGAVIGALLVIFIKGSK